MSYIIRSLTPNDEPFLWEMLYQVLFVPPGATQFPREIIYRSELAKYVVNWQTTDIGFIAIVESTQTPVGAAWIRLFNFNNQGYGYINDETPELSIALLPQYRNQGIGTQLMFHLLEHIQDKYPAVSLSVLPENPALKLYQRLGFEVVGQFDNSLTMKKEFN
jgi:ribosomal protein S18 acetylase RimI-like enzyme